MQNGCLGTSKATLTRSYQQLLCCWACAAAHNMSGNVSSSSSSSISSMAPQTVQVKPRARSPGHKASLLDGVLQREHGQPCKYRSAVHQQATLPAVGPASQAERRMARDWASKASRGMPACSAADACTYTACDLHCCCWPGYTRTHCERVTTYMQDALVVDPLTQGKVQTHRRRSTGGRAPQQTAETLTCALVSRLDVWSASACTSARDTLGATVARPSDTNCTRNASAGACSGWPDSLHTAGRLSAWDLSYRGWAQGKAVRAQCRLVRVLVISTQNSQGSRAYSKLDPAPQLSAYAQCTAI